MKQVSDIVIRFFEDYERRIKESAPELIVAVYNDPFVFASPHGVQVIKRETSATYILFLQEDLLRIVFQVDHQDLLKRVQDLGLLPAKD